MRAHFRNICAGASGRYGIAVATITLALLLSSLPIPLIGAASFHGLLLAGVVISAWWGGRGPGIVATVAAALAGSDRVFPSTWSLSVASGGDRLQLGIFLVEGVVLSVLIGMLHTRLRRASAALCARDELLAIAAHEFKTPLTTVIGFTQTLQMRAAREGHLPRRDLDTLRVIAGQAMRLHTLIDSMLDLTQLQNGQAQIARQEVDLAELAQRAVDDARLAAARHRIEFRGAVSPVLVAGDRVRLEQVLQNLLDNAVKYSPEGGTITVCVERQNAEAVLSVSDQGIGIPKEARAQLFDRFYRANNVDDRRMKGTGIGLSIVAEMVALHGGVVEVDSWEGQGSTFTIRLPRLNNKEHMQCASEPSTSRRTIWIS